MRLGLIVLFVAFLLAVVAGQNSLLQSTEAEDNSSAITACAVQGGSCAQPPLDSTPGSMVLEHLVFSEGCFSSDLHVVRYVPMDSADGEPVVAQWCS
jgi:hypothetical protein